jgi:ribosomal protein L32
MPKLTPIQEAEYAIAFNVGRAGLSKAGQLEYDRIIKEHAKARTAANGEQITDDPYSNCRECGEELTPNARFCASCGQPAGMTVPETTCSECGEELAPNARFCASCGQPTKAGAQTVGGRREQSREFAVKFATFYDGSGHRLGPSTCTLTSTRLIISDARGGIHQIPLSSISGISTPSRMVAPKMLRISLPGQGYDIECNSRDDKMVIENWLEEALRGSFG